MTMDQIENRLDLSGINMESSYLFRDDDFPAVNGLSASDITYDDFSDDWEEDFYNIFVVE